MLQKRLKGWMKQSRLIIIYQHDTTAMLQLLLRNRPKLRLITFHIFIIALFFLFQYNLVCRFAMKSVWQWPGESRFHLNCSHTNISYQVQIPPTLHFIPFNLKLSWLNNINSIIPLQKHTWISSNGKPVGI